MPAHIFGKPLHRSTERRRFEAQERYVYVPGRTKRGRGYSDENQLKSFVLFTAAVIQNVNETGYCDYAAIWQQPRRSGFGFHYRDVPEQHLRELADSGFQPAMLAVAVCDTVPLNFKTPRKPSLSSKLFLHQKVKVEITKSGTTCNAENFSIAEKRERLKAVLREDGDEPARIRLYLEEAQKVEYKADWVRSLLSKYKSPTDRKFSGAIPSVASSRGTPAHRVDYSGVDMSRRMAFYWRKHPRFQHCLRFIRSLFTRPIPKTPYEDGLTMIDWEVDSAFKQHMQLRRDKQKAVVT